MKWKDILAEWEKDSKIDMSNLAEESLKIPTLHSKYMKLYMSARLHLMKMEADYKKLCHEKREFFIYGPNEETDKKGWKLPERGRILKNEVEPFVETDSEVVKKALEIGEYREKVQFLESIVKNLNNRGFQIKNAIDFLKFTNGIN